MEFLSSLEVKKVLAQVSLDDPIISAFDSDRIKKVMQTMDHKEDEVLEHNMIDKSIERALKKIKNGEMTEDYSKAFKEWLDSLV